MEFHPVYGSIMGPRGGDLAVVHLVRRAFETARWRTRVDTGRFSFPVGDNDRNVDDRHVAGLKDDNDIRQLCNLMVTKLIVIDPDETARRLDSIAEAYRGVLSVKLKENAVKQDIEKQEEANKSVLRVTLLLGDKMKAMTGNAGAATSNAGAAGVWTLYWEWVNKEFEKQIKSLREETKELQTRMV